MASSNLPWQSAYFSLMGIVLNTMMLPGNANGLPEAYSTCFRIGPIYCIVDALATVISVATGWWTHGSLLQAALAWENGRHHVDDKASDDRREEGVLESDVDDEASDDRREGGALESLRKNTLFSVIAFTIGGMPAVIRLYGCTGIPVIQFLMTAYLVDFLVDKMVSQLCRMARHWHYENPAHPRIPESVGKIALTCDLLLFHIGATWALLFHSDRTQWQVVSLWLHMTSPLDVTVGYTEKTLGVESLDLLLIIGYSLPFGLSIYSDSPIYKSRPFLIFTATSSLIVLSISAFRFALAEHLPKHPPVGLRTRRLFSVLKARLYMVVVNLLVLQYFAYSYDPSLTQKLAWWDAFG